LIQVLGDDGAKGRTRNENEKNPRRRVITIFPGSKRRERQMVMPVRRLQREKRKKLLLRRVDSYIYCHLRQRIGRVHYPTERRSSIHQTIAISYIGCEQDPALV
jgi:hypothetical protein